MLRRVVLDHAGQRYNGTVRNMSLTGALIEGLWNVPPARSSASSFRTATPSPPPAAGPAMIAWASSSRSPAPGRGWPDRCRGDQVAPGPPPDPFANQRKVGWAVAERRAWAGAALRLSGAKNQPFPKSAISLLPVLSGLRRISRSCSPR
jgi:hypothetical protein